MNDLSTMHPALRRAIIAARSAPVPRRMPKVVQPMTVVVAPAHRPTAWAVLAPVDPPSYALQIKRFGEVNKIIRAVSAATGVKVTDIVGHRRFKPIIHARWIAMYLSQVDAGKSLAEIGRAFGGRDHSTIFHALGKITAKMAADPEFAAKVEAIRESVEK